MVNEINKPIDPLNERLDASNQQLREMQEEHRQLLQEMEGLRARAAELSRLNLQRQQLQESVAENQNDGETASLVPEKLLKTEVPVTEKTLSNSSKDHPSSEEGLKILQKEGVEDAADNKDVEENETETADYLQQKISEIAALKAQFKRVEHMVNTTNIIEEHLKSKSATSENYTKSVCTEGKESCSGTKFTESNSSSSDPLPTNTLRPSTSGTSENPKEELLSAMLNMFTDFSEDLRGQAESLRAERERIKSLKEELMKRRKGDS